LGGCGSSRSHGGAPGATFQPAPPASPPASPPDVILVSSPAPVIFVPVGPTLVAQVTNGSTATISVSVTTPDLVLSAGQVSPGETIQLDLGELPSYATFSATAVTSDASGEWPSFPDI